MRRIRSAHAQIICASRAIRIAGYIRGISTRMIAANFHARTAVAVVALRIHAAITRKTSPVAENLA